MQSKGLSRVFSNTTVQNHQSCNLIQCNFEIVKLREGLPGGSAVKNPAANVEDAGGPGSIPGWGRSSGEGSGTPLQYSCLGNPMDRGAWWAAVHGVTKKLDTTKELNNNKTFY